MLTCQSLIFTLYISQKFQFDDNSLPIKFTHDIISSLHTFSLIQKFYIMILSLCNDVKDQIHWSIEGRVMVEITCEQNY